MRDGADQDHWKMALTVLMLCFPEWEQGQNVKRWKHKQYINTGIARQPQRPANLLHHVQTRPKRKATCELLKTPRT
ncbi:hypothetical protein Y032_0012g1752 [Ancylostoma ceylanicum]|uniref:Uncharacterized protein n=1 Tax=Ancylostoma ceylanicum TaxID=53326 RepID=A0A016VDT0_9BILA|nr:hypothetical protein Y032_0012g1752 [Ancylostoma ceylanicum]